MHSVGTISEMWRYPIKSLGGERIASAVLDRLGIPGDRRLALRNLDNDKIVSAKIPRFGRELLALRASLDEASGHVMVSSSTATLGEAMSEELRRELSARLGIPVRMETATTADELYESYWPELEGMALSGIETDLPLSLMTEKGTFVDLAALHVISSSALERLGELLPSSVVTSVRFRPSLVIDTSGVPDGPGAPGTSGWVESGWTDRTATLGGAKVAFGSITPRCVMTTLEQLDLPADREILRTLAAQNRMTIDGIGDFAGFGIYAEVVQPGRVQVGDQLLLDE